MPRDYFLHDALYVYRAYTPPVKKDERMETWLLWDGRGQQEGPATAENPLDR